MDLELVLFKTCPFAQRVVIALSQTGLAHRFAFINPMQPPDWFKEIAPLGQIPLLRIDGKTVLFDSTAINEYLNDLVGGKLLPEDPLIRARYRCWVEFSGVCQRGLGTLITAKDQEQFDNMRNSFLTKWHWLEKELADASALGTGSIAASDQNISLVDIAYAPLFMRVQHLHKIVPFYHEADFPHMEHWLETLLALDVVQKSVEDPFSALFLAVIRGRGKGGFVDSQLG